MTTHPTDDDYARLLGLRTELRRFLRWSEDRAAAVGLSPAQHQLLLAIRGHRPRRPGPTVGDVADSLLLHHHSTVELVNRAAAAGLVQRRADASDGRVVRLTLTDRARSKLRRLSAAHMEELAQIAPAFAALNRPLDGPARRPPARRPPSRPDDS